MTVVTRKGRAVDDDDPIFPVTCVKRPVLAQSDEVTVLSSCREVQEGFHVVVLELSSEVMADVALTADRYFCECRRVVVVAAAV